GSPVRLTAMSPEGLGVELRTFQHSRPDVEQLHGLPTRGFISYFDLPARSHVGEGWLVEMRVGDSQAWELPCPPPIVQPELIRKTVLEDLARDSARSTALLEGHTHPALSRLQTLHALGAEIATVLEYGRGPSAPDVSVIVPLYRRLDFVEHQLAQFIHDPEFREVELIYVLDSPELADALRDSAEALHALYRVPFRVALLPRNLGFALANDLGVSIARGRLVV